MTTEHDTHGNELDPQILAALIAVPPVEDARREAHIASALAHAPVLSRSRPQFLRIAAACVALVLAGGLVGRFSSTSSPTENADSIRPSAHVKNGVPDAKSCETTVPNSRYVGSYSLSGARRLVFVTSLAVLVLDESTCAIISTIPHSPVQP